MVISILHPERKSVKDPALDSAITAGHYYFLVVVFFCTRENETFDQKIITLKCHKP